MLQTIVDLLQRLLQALFQVMSRGGGGAGSCLDSEAGGGSAGAPCGGGAPPACGGGAGMPPSLPATTSGAEAVPPRAAPPGDAERRCAPGRARARPRRKSSVVSRILGQVGRGAAQAAPALVPGGAAVKAGAAAASRIASGARNNGSVLDGGSLEDRIFAFLSGKVREAEAELDAAMRQGDSGGGNGDSRTLASQRVQQLVSKRAELVEALTNTMKSAHESTMAVSRNFK
jgi:hypothetical protein